MQVAVRSTLLFVPQAMLDAEQAMSFLRQNGRGQVPDGMEAEAFHSGPLAQAFHDMRGGLIRLADERLHRASEDMVARPLSVFPEPEQGLPDFGVQRHFIAFHRSGTGFARGQRDRVPRKVHLVPGQSKQFAFPGREVQITGQQGLFPFRGNRLHFPEIRFRGNVTRSADFRIALTTEERIGLIQRKAVQIGDTPAPGRGQNFTVLV